MPLKIPTGAVIVAPLGTTICKGPTVSWRPSNEQCDFKQKSFPTKSRLSRGLTTENWLWRFYVHCHFYAGGDPAWVMGCWWITLLFIVQCAGWCLLVAQRTEGLPRRMPGNTPIIFRRENSLTVTNKSCSSSLGSWHKMYNCSWWSLGGAPKGPRIISVGSVRVKCTPLRQCVPTLPKRLGRSNGYSGKRGVLMFKSPRKEWLSGGGQALPGGWE